MSTERTSNAYCDLFVVRHGLTDYNAERRLQGQLDVPLNDIGREQCIECGEKLKRMQEGQNGVRTKICSIYASPLSRTRESAEIIKAAAGLQCAVVLDDRIKEWSAGVLEGHLLDEVSKLFPREWAAWSKSRDPEFVFPGGESFKQRYDRVSEFFIEVAERHAGEAILVVTHGGVLDDLFRLVRNVPMNLKTNAPKLNAEIHSVRARISGHDKGGPTFADGASEQSANPKSICRKPSISWEIIKWGRLKKDDQVLTGGWGNTPIDISVRGIEYA